MDEELQKKTYEEIESLKDLFLRRLLDDKVKMVAISTLREQNEALQKILNQKILTDVVREIIMVCDRINAQDNQDDLALSVKEELLEIIARREYYPMDSFVEFNPVFHNAVGTVEETDRFPVNHIVKVIRTGYMYRESVFRPADVIVSIKKKQ